MLEDSNNEIMKNHRGNLRMIMFIRNNSPKESNSSQEMVYDRKQYGKGSVVSSEDGHISVNSASSETSFLGRVKDKWGDEESELR